MRAVGASPSNDPPRIQPPWWSAVPGGLIICRQGPSKGRWQLIGKADMAARIHYIHTLYMWRRSCSLPSKQTAIASLLFFLLSSFLPSSFLFSCQWTVTLTALTSSLKFGCPKYVVGCEKKKMNRHVCMHMLLIINKQLNRVTHFHLSLEYICLFLLRPRWKWHWDGGIDD